MSPASGGGRRPQQRRDFPANRFWCHLRPEAADHLAVTADEEFRKIPFDCLGAENSGRARLEEDDHSSTHGPNRIAQTSEFGRTPRLGTSGKGHADKQCRGNHGKESHVTTHRLLSAQCAVEMLDPQGLQVIPTADAGDSASLATNDVAVAPWFCGPDFRRVCSEQRQRSGRNQRPPDCCEIMHESFQTIIAGKMAL